MVRASCVRQDSRNDAANHEKVSDVGFCGLTEHRRIRVTGGQPLWPGSDALTGWINAEAAQSVHHGSGKPEVTEGKVMPA